MKPGSVIRFDPQDITRLGLETLVPTACASRAVRTKSELVATLAVRPDAVVVIDYALSDLGSADSLINIGLRFPGVRWILFSDELSVRFLRKMVCESAFGMVLKNCELFEIRTALDRALDGGIYVCAQVRELLSASGRGEGGEGGPLTATEREILREIVLGRSAKEIAARRGVSALTVTTHRKNIYRKIEVNNSQEAAGYALRAGVVDTSDYFI
jgi:DNA-binding NarL/FixJ family response regulator